MPIYSGVDIVEIERIKGAFQARGDAFSKRIFTPLEVDYCESKKAEKYQSYAVRFAGKEAVSKALGTGIDDGIKWTDIEILNDDKGNPYVILSGNALERFKSMHGKMISISLSHCKSYAVANVVLETKNV